LKLPLSPVPALLLATLLSQLPAGACAAELTLSFPNLRAGGSVAYAVHGSPETWKRRKEPVKAGHLPWQAETQVILDLPPGAYAVMAYHDRNANGRLDTLPIGMPIEPYGFSNNARGSFGPPAWKAASFVLDASGAVQAIDLR
jgi:uncharacterized protein (DUF2141 family)